MHATFDQRVSDTVAALRTGGVHVTPDLRINARGAALLIGVAQGTLRNWRSEAKGPVPVIAGQVWYRVPDVLRWIDGQAAKDWCDAAA